MIFSDKCRKDLIFEKCLATNCCTRGACTLPLVSIIKKKCNSNAKTMLSAQGEMILYALRPIKKNDQVNTFNEFKCYFLFITCKTNF